MAFPFKKDDIIQVNTQIKKGDGTVLGSPRFKARCPGCRTWAGLTERQFRGVEKLVCSNPGCEFQGYFNLYRLYQEKL